MDSFTLLKESFELQVSEIEMLSSMYPDSGEFCISLPHVVADVNKYISGESTNIPNQIDFTLNLQLEDLKDKLEVNVCFPHEYPFSKPEVTVRSASLARPQQRELNSAITDFLNSLTPGNLCILPLINWLTESAGHFFSYNNQTNYIKHDIKAATTDDLCRMWIYSHHIYSKFKRREIIDTANDLKLTGFSLPGKPGFICVEGLKKNCGEFLQCLKKMSWKKISLVKEETVELNETDINEFRKFENFGEISFQVRKGPAKEYHMDMGQFLKFLGEHDCAYAFQDLFGFEGQTSAEK